MAFGPPTQKRCVLCMFKVLGVGSRPFRKKHRHASNKVHILTKTQNMTWRKDMWTSKIRDISELRYNVIKWSRQALLMLQNSGNCHLWMYKSRPFCCIIFTTKSQLQQPPLTALTLHWCFFWTPRWLRHKWIWENPCSSMGWDTNLGRRPEFPRQNFGKTLLKVKLLVGPTFVNSHDQLKGAKGIRRSPKMCQVSMDLALFFFRNSGLALSPHLHKTYSRILRFRLHPGQKSEWMSWKMMGLGKKGILT